MTALIDAKLVQKEKDGYDIVITMFELFWERNGETRADKHISIIILQYADFKNYYKRFLILVSQKKRLQMRLESKNEPRMIRLIIDKTLKSKEKQLEELQGSPPCTPPSSDSE